MSKMTKMFSLMLILVFGMFSLVGCTSGGKEQAGGDKAKESETVVIKLAHENVPKHPMGQAFIKFKELVESRSNGAIKVDIYDSGKFGNAREIVEGIQTGQIQMGSSSTPNLVPFSKDFMIFDLPFLFPNYESTDKVTDGPIGKKAATALESSNIKGLGYIEIGFRHIFNSAKPVNTMADLKGLKIRSTASKAHIATLKALGTNPTPVAWGEVYTALQQKAVDGIDIDLNLAWFNNFHEVNKNLTLVNSIYSPHLVMINKSFFDKLSPENQKIITEAFEEIKVYERKLIRDNEKMIIGKMKEAGVNIVELTPEEKQKWAEATVGVYNEFGDVIGKDLIEQVRETVKK
ncbi:TRAP transporter substrate-binding protein [Desulfotomaculum varum]